MKKVKSVSSIKDLYSKRILSNIINQDPWRVYSSTPRALKQLTGGLNKKQLQTPPGKGRWPIAYLISHFCDAECAMSYRIRWAIAESGGPLQAYNQDKWANNLYYHKADCGKKLELFTVLRNANVSLLGSLTQAEWQHYGIHEERGKETVERMVQMLAGHDVNHLKQVKNIRNSFLKKRTP